MNIVANIYVLKYFKEIEYFKIDLGWRVKEMPDVNKKIFQGEKKPKMKIRDEFVKTYFDNYGRMVFKIGKIAFINFYDDLQMKNDELYVFKDDKIYEVEFGAKYKSEPRSFLSDLLESIDNNVIEATSELALTDLGGKIATNMGDIDRPDISLPTEQYVYAMIERRRLLTEKLK